MAELAVVTGALGYTGKYIARRLLVLGQRVRTLTRHPGRPNPFADRLEIASLDFDNPATLRKSLEGAVTLYNTYWVRFCYGRTDFGRAVQNTKTLLEAAAQAGVSRIVHLSVTNPSESSPLPYFRGKALVERAIIQSGLPYVIVRPTLTFGPEDILINNIAWLLRRFSVFAIPGSGKYSVQPVFVDDVAELAISAGQTPGNCVLDAAGPEIFSFEQLVRLIASQVESNVGVVHVPPGLALCLTRLIGCALRDVMLTRDELVGLMAGLLVSSGPATARTRFSDWIAQKAEVVGRNYVSELSKHYR